MRVIDTVVPGAISLSSYSCRRLESAKTCMKLLPICYSLFLTEGKYNDFQLIAPIAEIIVTEIDPTGKGCGLRCRRHPAAPGG